MKKFLSILMVLALVLSLSVTAFATENTTPTGSITVSNATIGTIYKVYKIFDASINKTEGEADAVSYSITTENPYFNTLFGNGENTYFTYYATTGNVTKKDGVNDSDLIDYLKTLVTTSGFDPVATIEATEDKITFTNLPYGYYLVTSSLGATVTINSNTPNVSVIDKNQKPGNGFDKQVKADDGTWVDANSANIGDKVTYKISFQATNYDGDKLIKYYSINDEKGDAIWAEFTSFHVFVGDTELTRGYYLAQGGENTDNWEYLGTWPDNIEKKRDNAQWYLVHLGEDQFRITIPWLKNHQVKDVTNDNGDVISYSLVFPENPVSAFDSPATVEVYYDALIEANAAIGETSHGNRFNKAYASWTSQYETGSTRPDEVVTNVYGIGLLKDDMATGQNLAGAEFRVYRDAAHTIPVNVIPTKIAGVYIVDSLGADIEDATGSNKDTTRDVYAAYLDAYLNGKTADNLVVSQANGKLAILGLKEGSYFLVEVKPPAGYNALTHHIEIKAGEDILPFVIFADENGNVADIQTSDGIHIENKMDLTSTVVHNSKGTVLPSTGGEGTFWLITIGSLLAIGFAVFLITHKKMSVYTD